MSATACDMRQFRRLPESPTDKAVSMNWGVLIAIAIAVLQIIQENMDD
jgi:hypothetical protein